MALNKAKRSAMSLKVFTVKVDYSHLSREVKEKLENSFVQAKWLYNDMLNDQSFFTRDSKERKVIVHVFNKETGKCDIKEERTLTLGSQIIQSLIERGQQNIVNLSKAKKAGLKVGGLDFSQEVNSIPLKQFGSTHKISGKNYMRIQGIGKLKISGLTQLDGKDCASAVLFRDSTGYYIKICCYQNKEKIAKSGKIGLDFGIKDNIVLSNGEKFNWSFPPTIYHKRKQRKLSKRKKGSKNYVKQIKKIQKSHVKLINKKNDAANKFISKLKSYETVVFQDENLKGWHSGLFGKQVQHSVMGRIKTKLKNLETSIMINRWLLTTKISPISGKNIKINLSERMFVDGDFSEDRDIKSAKTILCFGLYNPKLTSTELRSLPVEELTAVFSNYMFESNKSNPMKQEATAL
jgi:transposase